MLLKVSPEKIRSIGFGVVNKLRLACNYPQLEDFKLLSKSENMSVSNAMKNAVKIFVPDLEADTFSYISVGKISDSSYHSEIMTFYDKCKRVVMRAFKKNGELNKMRCYEYPSCDSRVISTYEPSHSGDNFALVTAEYQRITTLRLNSQLRTEKCSQRISSKKIVVSDSDGKKTREITFLYTPFNRGVGKPSDRRLLKGLITKEGNDIVLGNIEKTDNVDLDMNDKYLTVRFLDPRTDIGIHTLTRQLLKSKFLDKLRISIFTNCQLSENTEGSFSAASRSILFKNFSNAKFHERAVDCVAHEVEHAYQYAQIGRLGKGKTSYETDAMRILGELDNTDEIREAVKYSVADLKYPYKDANWSNPFYRDNYLERKAREASEKIVDEYENSKNYNFFEEFDPISVNFV